MVEYTTLKAEEIKYGTNNFIEVARKEIDGNEFISLSKGYFTPDGQRRYKTGLGFPDEGGIAKFLADSLIAMSEDTGEPKAEETKVSEVSEEAPEEKISEEPQEEETPEEAPVKEEKVKDEKPQQETLSQPETEEAGQE